MRLIFPFQVQKCEWNVRLAKPEELIQVAEAQAEVAEIECGVNPMAKDREGFLKRVMRRIEQGRIFVVFDGDKLVFKADIIAETDNVIYLEGIYTGHEYRGQGIGSRCLAALSLQLVERVENICMLSNVDFDIRSQELCKGRLQTFRSVHHIVCLIRSDSDKQKGGPLAARFFFLDAFANRSI